jgi:hypothetical protein
MSNDPRFSWLITVAGWFSPQHGHAARGGTPERGFRFVGMAQLVLHHAELVPRIQGLRMARPEGPLMAFRGIAGDLERGGIVAVQLQRGRELQLQPERALRVLAQHLARLRQQLAQRRHGLLLLAALTQQLRAGLVQCDAQGRRQCATPGAQLGQAGFAGVVVAGEDGAPRTSQQQFVAQRCRQCLLCQSGIEGGARTRTIAQPQPGGTQHLVQAGDRTRRQRGRFQLGRGDIQDVADAQVAPLRMLGIGLGQHALHEAVHRRQFLRARFRFRQRRAGALRRQRTDDGRGQQRGEHDGSRRCSRRDAGARNARRDRRFVGARAHSPVARPAPLRGLRRTRRRWRSDDPAPTPAPSSPPG